MDIRPYDKKDKQDVRFICLNSEGPCDMDANDRFYILTTYCDYYIEQEPHNCFVAVDNEDKAIGYIICTENFDRFFPVFQTEYITRFSPLQLNYRIGAARSVDLQKKYKNEYPAHMHIDVLPEYQRMGLGHKLVDALCRHLRSKNIPGLMLTVGTSNQVGQSFYNKYGFTLLEKTRGDIAYGMKLSSEK